MRLDFQIKDEVEHFEILIVEEFLCSVKIKLGSSHESRIPHNNSRKSSETRHNFARNDIGTFTNLEITLIALADLSDGRQILFDDFDPVAATP